LYLFYYYYWSYIYSFLSWNLSMTSKCSFPSPDFLQIGRWIVLYSNYFHKTWVICSFLKAKQSTCLSFKHGDHGDVWIRGKETCRCLREHEVKAWQGDMFSQKCGFFTFVLHLKCVFANILFISFIFNIKFMFCICFILYQIGRWIMLYSNYFHKTWVICSFLKAIQSTCLSFKHGDHGDVGNQKKKQKQHTATQLYC
jgi:hypothetical protein